MSDLSEVKQLIEAQAKAWHDYKENNDARIKADGEQKAEFSEKLSKIDSDLNSLGKEMADLQAKAALPDLGPMSEADRKLTPEQREHKSAFRDEFLRKGDPTGLRELERKAMNSTSDVSGGYLVDKAMEAEIERVAGTLSAMSRVSRVTPIGNRSLVRRYKTGGMAITWPGEGRTSGESGTPTYARTEYVAHPGEVEPWVENETLEDADVDLAADLAQEAAIAFAEGFGSAYVVGDGVEKPKGFTTYTGVANASWAWGKLGFITSGANGAFAASNPADKIIALQHALKAQYRPGAVFMMSDAVLSLVRQIKDGSGAFYLWGPDPLAGFGGRLLGSPVEIEDYMPALATGSISMAFGNFQRGYQIVPRTGMTLIRDNVTQKGVTKFNFRRRVGGGVSNFEAIKLMKFST